ncbi:MAG: hypothetical protein JRN11_07340 [Nitrososphaerota archaeon]|nr:hypothetical protein [Nitrososphaerota archaeon]MDG7026544.1 hypothetical protein [Nitrososphaerota archaeon]
MADPVEVDIPAEAASATDARDGDEIELAIAFPSVLNPGSVIHVWVVGVYDARKQVVRVGVPDEFAEFPTLFADLVRCALRGTEG